jgi:N-acetylglucosaminyldiphosphoundecaprenol N-acetyl-beta-D-mannosaminyltransferase
VSTGVQKVLDVRHRVGPLHFVSADLDEAVEAVRDHAVSRHSGAHVHLLNAYSIALADQHDEYRAALSGDAVNLPDGLPVSWVSQLRRDDLPLQQIRGVRFFLRSFESGQSVHLKHFLLGSTPETLSKLEDALRSRFPGALITGTHSPPFRPLTPQELVDQDRLIAQSGAHVVWVGLGTPKQDFEAVRLSRSLPVTAVAVGAAFDFVAGTVKEAPAIMSRLGLEWLHRFSREPRRLWRRYVFGNVRFLYAAANSRRRLD